MPVAKDLSMKSEDVWFQMSWRCHWIHFLVICPNTPARLYNRTDHDNRAEIIQT